MLETLFFGDCIGVGGRALYGMVLEWYVRTIAAVDDDEDECECRWV